MVVVIGGHSRNIGKTSVVCGIIHALPAFEWTALKITQFGHGKCSRDGDDCGCAAGTHRVAFSEESAAGERHDSARYLMAGARRSFWLRTPQGGLAEAMPQLRRALAAGENTIIESNSVMGLLRPDLFYVVLSGGITDFKPSTLRHLDRANGFVFTSSERPVWPEVPAQLLSSKRHFTAPAPAFESAELAAAIKVHRSSAD